MRLGGRLQAAIEVLAEIEDRHRPVQEALKDWGNAHRFAGSGDRAAIGNLVFDALRWRASTAFRMGDESARALVLGTVAFHWNTAPDALIEALDTDPHAPHALTPAERDRLADGSLELAPDWIKADVPEWTAQHFEANFGEDWVAEAAALAARAPLDLRVNTLKTNRDRVARDLKRQKAKPTAIALNGLRIEAGTGPRRLPNIQAEAGYRKGWFEIQDEGSQIAASLVFARPGEQILDYCAGGGGKTLAMAADMDNRGQIHAYDSDPHRLAGIHQRLKRAGTRNVRVLKPSGEGLEALEGRMDRVVVDAPCTGSGVWRRRPDTKWRLSEAALEQRVEQQDAVLEEAARYVRPGGYLVYITCSLFPLENEGRVYGFLESAPDFVPVSAGEVWQDLFGFDKPRPWSSDMLSVTLTPASTGTDGFFFAVLERTG